MTQPPYDEPHYWYVTDAAGTKFFCDDVQLSLSDWRAGAPEHDLEQLERDIKAYGPLKLAPVWTGERYEEIAP